MNENVFLPFEVIFNPNWWRQSAGISFDENFYLDPDTRIQNDIIMRRMLYERFGDLGLGQSDPQPRPVIGSMHVAGGFVIPALLGSCIRFSTDAAPQPLPLGLTPTQIDALEFPRDYDTFKEHWPMNVLIAQMDTLEAEYGYVVGDLNTDGLLNAAYHLYGQELFIDFYTYPERVKRVLTQISELIINLATYMRSRSGSCSISVNRMVKHVDLAMFLHANCSVQMISPDSYRAIQLPIEKRMAERMQPFGVHHCGNNLHKLAPLYAELPLSYVEVGWDSDVEQCRQALPDIFLNLRLSPVRLLTCTPQQAAEDAEHLLQAAGPLERVGLCCINMDAGTPDENIYSIYEVVRRYRGYGA